MWFSPTCMLLLAKFRFEDIVYSQIKEELPKDGEQDTLQTVRNDTGLETATKQTQDAVLQDDQSSRLG
jgi:hypothetical protein